MTISLPSWIRFSGLSLVLTLATMLSPGSFARASSPTVSEATESLAMNLYNSYGRVLYGFTPRGLPCRASVGGASGERFLAWVTVTGDLGDLSSASLDLLTSSEGASVTSLEISGQRISLSVLDHAGSSHPSSLLILRDGGAIRQINVLQGRVGGLNDGFTQTCNISGR